MNSVKGTLVSGHSFTVGSDGRKVDEDGFKTAMGTRWSNKLLSLFCVSVKIQGDQASVRDTKDPLKTTLTFTKEEWQAFVQGVKNGEFDI